MAVPSFSTSAGVGLAVLGVAVEVVAGEVDVERGAGDRELLRLLPVGGLAEQVEGALRVGEQPEGGGAAVAEG